MSKAEKKVEPKKKHAVNTVSRILKKAGIESSSVIDSPVVVSFDATRADKTRAKIKNPNYCVLARAACRSLPNIADAWFYKTAAYLHQVLEDGTERMIRFIPSKEAQLQIEKFDETGEFDVGTYLLLPPKASQTLDAITKRNVERNKRGRHKPGAGKLTRKLRASGRIAYSEPNE